MTVLVLLVGQGGVRSWKPEKWPPQRKRMGMKSWRLTKKKSRLSCLMVLLSLFLHSGSRSLIMDQYIQYITYFLSYFRGGKKKNCLIFPHLHLTR